MVDSRKGRHLTLLQSFHIWVHTHPRTHTHTFNTCEHEYMHTHHIHMQNKFITLRNSFAISMGVRRAERNILGQLIEMSFFILSQGHGSLFL